MELPNTDNEHNITSDTPGSAFDTSSASQERLAWRLGREEATPDAQALDAQLAAETAEAVRSEKAQKRLRERLGGAAAASSSDIPRI